MLQKAFSLFILIFSAACTFMISDLSALEGSVVTDIVIEGNQRSKDSYILSIIEISVGDTWYSGIEEDVRQNLLDEKLFQRETLTVSGEDDDEGYRLLIHVEDCWTLLPVPVAGVSSDKWMAGLMLVERNFLGCGIMLIAGFIYGSDMMAGILMVETENLTLSGGYNKFERDELTTADGEVRTLRRYNLDMPYFDLIPAYKKGDWRFSWNFRYQGPSVDWIAGEAGVPTHIRHPSQLICHDLV